MSSNTNEMSSDTSLTNDRLSSVTNIKRFLIQIWTIYLWKKIGVDIHLAITLRHCKPAVRIFISLRKMNGMNGLSISNIATPFLRSPGPLIWRHWMGRDANKAYCIVAARIDVEKPSSERIWRARE